MSNLNRIILFVLPLVFVAGLFALFAANIGRDTRLVPSVLLNQPAPDFSLPPIENYASSNGGFNTASLTGQVSVVNVFASWCIPCRDEHPLLGEIKRQLPNVQLLGINQKDATENAISFLEELGNPYDAIGADANGRTSIDWGVYGVPETFVVNADGIITYKHIGPISPESLTEDVIPAIQAAIDAGTDPA